MRVEKTADQHRAKKISDGEWKEIQTDPIGGDTVKVDQNKSVGKKNRVVEKCLRCHEAQTDEGATAVVLEKSLIDQPKRRRLAGAQARAGKELCGRGGCKPGCEAANDPRGLLDGAGRR